MSSYGDKPFRNSPRGCFYKKKAWEYIRNSHLKGIDSVGFTKTGCVHRRQKNKYLICENLCFGPLLMSLNLLECHICNSAKLDPLGSSRGLLTQRLAECSADEQAKLCEVKRLAEKLMKNHGVDNVEFGWTLSRNYLGYVDYSHTHLCIQLNYALTGSMKDIRNLILHEIAHLLCPQGAGHRLVWQQKAKELGVDFCGRRYHK